MWPRYGREKVECLSDGTGWRRVLWIPWRQGWQPVYSPAQWKIIFLRRSARILIKVEKSIDSLHEVNFNRFEREYSFFQFHFPDTVLENTNCRMDKKVVLVAVIYSSLKEKIKTVRFRSES
jgi:hypothetical protein